MKAYKISKAAYDRGFGTPHEMFAMRRRRPPTEAAPRYEVTETLLSSHLARGSLEIISDRFQAERIKSNDL